MGTLRVFHPAIHLSSSLPRERRSDRLISLGKRLRGASTARLTACDCIASHTALQAEVRKDPLAALTASAVAGGRLLSRYYFNVRRLAAPAAEPAAKRLTATNMRRRRRQQPTCQRQRPPPLRLLEMPARRPRTNPRRAQRDGIAHRRQGALRLPRGPADEPALPR